jgi:hypothetical protein
MPKAQNHHNTHVHTKSSNLTQAFLVEPWIFKLFYLWLTELIWAQTDHEASIEDHTCIRCSSFYPYCCEIGAAAWVGLRHICNRIANAVVTLGYLADQVARIHFMAHPIGELAACNLGNANFLR